MTRVLERKKPLIVSAFCDVWAYVPKGIWPETIIPELKGNIDILPDVGGDGSVQLTLKLLSVDPANYDDAPSEGIRRLLQLVRGVAIPLGDKYDTSIIGMCRCVGC